MDLVKRSEFGWGASGASYAKPTRGLVIHYDGSNQGLADKPHSACVTYWKNTRRFHMNSRGWADIGYSFGACPHGYVFEGRGLNKQQAAQPGGNSTYYSCTLMSGPKETPPSTQIEAVRELRAWLMGKGVASAVKGHRDFVSTSCPGEIAYRMVKDGVFAKKPAPSPEPPKPPAPAPNWTEVMIKKLPTLKRGDTGEHVETLQALLRARSHAEVTIDGSFGALTETALESVQRWGGVKDDGIAGQDTWPVLLRVHE